MLLISVKFTLIALIVALLFVGKTLVAADNTGRGLLPGDGRILNSLRFWERDNPPPNRPANPSRETLETPRPPQPSTPQSGPPQSQHSSGTNQAPVPPPMPHLGNDGGSLGNAPLPGRGSIENPQVANPAPAFLSSFSFDRRDWVENYHLQGQAATHGGNPRGGDLGEIQATSFHAPMISVPSVTTRTTIPSELQNAEANQWNGQAITLEALFTPATVEEPPLDLTPSFTSRLPHTRTCGVVVVQANFPLTEITAILAEIEQLQHDLTYYIGVPAPREKIELCLFRDEASYHSFLREFFPRAPRDRRALFIKLDGKPGVLLVQKSKDFEIDLRHEMTHAILHASIPRVPIWLDEGLAKYFEVPKHERATKHPYMSSVRGNARIGMVPSLDRLTRMEGIDDMQAREYRESWAWVHFMIHRSPETQQLLAAYLQMLATLEPESASRARDNRATPIQQMVGALSGRERQASIPSLRLYLDRIVPNQREAFREHFSSME